MFGKLVNTLLEYMDPVFGRQAPLKVFIYGSYARGKQTDQSDIDVCILMDPSSAPERKDLNLDQVLTEALGIEVHCVFCTMMNGWCEVEIYPTRNKLPCEA